MQAISKSFGGIPALSEASLEVMPAEIMALVGQNGAGKSTMIKILNGAHALDSGTIQFDGAPWTAGSPQQAQRAGISTIFQEINLIGYRSVAENIFLGREPRRAFGLLDWKKINEEAASLLARFDVKVDVRAPLELYSTAIQQMVAIARAVSFAARLVIMDEPTSSLDEAEVTVLLRTVTQLKAEGVSVLFVSHKFDELYKVCDRVTIMRDGKTVAVTPMADISKLELVASMLGRELDEVQKKGATAFKGSAGKIGGELLSAKGVAIGHLVRDADVDVRSGEIVGLAGLLGSGRTETARAIFAADQRSAGDITFDGVTTNFKGPREAIAAGMGYCSEDRKSQGIIPGMTVAENLTLALMPALTRSGLLDEAKQREVVERFIKEIGIKCAGPNQKIRELSGGNQQKVLLARWLCMNPKLLILDEPTRGIDVGAKAEIQALIRRLATDGLGVLMISSELEEIVEGADRVFVLREGRTVGEFNHENLTEGDIMRAMAHDDAEDKRHADGAPARA
ncbi:MAG: sugar ABC transporter ATP-binding protein [Alphaproteobacteria bacterium]|jgi:galactofuranose transport system ATP-binding protein|nr:sugar ABC transporter ATP-binding protein [Alphaproteobacteria bacterium]MBU0802847.1 sugar ABC transporter ATP-binding protein [Alphaproteobacteria bacterium]MBU0871644.1 sugar ABC transporter ATP-binding protein [Alphaproteobacteria bacterium]MBU1400311.1 sugar ABC transporter ATP-binding protein [Alphaproteobacteria bacterium]MBU1591431.1 sugar ABC transporter ATP-binding protein [Alphaproteobacteria bacterium]